MYIVICFYIYIQSTPQEFCFAKPLQAVASSCLSACSVGRSSVKAWRSVAPQAALTEAAWHRSRRRSLADGKIEGPGIIYHQ